MILETEGTLYSDSHTAFRKHKDFVLKEENIPKEGDGTKDTVDEEALRKILEGNV